VFLDEIQNVSRSNTFASKFVSSYVKVVGLPYLQQNIKPSVVQIMKEFTFSNLASRGSTLEVKKLFFSLA
jgi:hypothetical protein